MLNAVDSAIATLPEEGRLFAFVLLHSTHFPYNGKVLGSPDENFGDAIRFLDDRVSRLIHGLENRNTSFLALVGGDHGTLLGDCGRVGYTAIHDASLHTAMMAVGSRDTAPALERLYRLRDSMVTVPSLLPLILDPDPGVARRDDPTSRWSVAMLTSVSSATASLTAHNTEGDAFRVDLGRNSATWTCGRLDECAAPASETCRPELIREAGDALLKLQRPNASLPRPPAP